MYWTSIGNAKPLADAVTVTEDDLNEDEYKGNEAVYEKAVQNALYEALGKSKGNNMTELQKLVALHDWIVVNCQYDKSFKHMNHSKAYGAIVDGYAVCAGYNSAYIDLLSRVGIKAESVPAVKNNQSHVFSCVTLDGKNYYIDVTADDPVPDTPGKVSRQFFLVSDDVLNLAGYDSYTSHV